MNLRFYIVDKSNRPIVIRNNISILFDTGASVPVWCTGEKRFCRVFPNAMKQNFKYLLSGFGRTEKELREAVNYPDKNKITDFLMDVYKIPSFDLTDEKQTIAWKNLQVAVTEKKGIGAELILPSTIFRGMKLSWNQECIDAPYIEIQSKTSVKYVFVQQCEDKFFNQQLLKCIYSQESPIFNNQALKNADGSLA